MEESGVKVIAAKRLTAMNASTVIVNLGLDVDTVQCEARLWVRPIATGVLTCTKWSKYKAPHHHLTLITPDSTVTFRIDRNVVATLKKMVTALVFF